MSLFNYEKTLSLEWNGQVHILSYRNELSKGNNYLYSYNASNWTPGNVNLANTLSQTNPFNIRWTGSAFEMLGNLVSSSSNQNTVLKSTNGTFYSPVPATNTLSNTVYDLETNLETPHRITFPRNITLALGGSAGDTTKIAYSIDSGITWVPSGNSATVFTTTTNAAMWNGKIWVAVGQGGNTIATSPDGNVWTGRGATTFTTAGYGITWSKELALWVAAGQGKNTLAYSYDGVFWTGLGTPVFTKGNDILWNGTLFVAAGVPATQGNSIAYSLDGKAWSTPKQTNLFDLSGIKVGWNGQNWTVIGVSSVSTINTATSLDGKSWNVLASSLIPGNPNNFYTSPNTNVTLYTI
jgi:hypothetical protein